MNHISVDQALIKAKSYIKKGKIEEARLYCHNVLNFFPQNGRIHKLLVSLQNVKTPKSIINSITVMYNNKDFEDVIEKSDKFLNIYKEDGFLWNLNGLANFSLGRYNDALKAFQKTVKLDQNNPEYLNNLGIIFEKQQNWYCAIKAYKNALNLRPNFVEAIYNIANVFKAQKKFEISITYYNKALRLKPNYIRAYNNLGTIFLEQGKVDKALNIFQKALAINYNHPTIFNNIGNALQKKGRIKDSIESYKQAIKLNPNFFQSYNNLGNSLKQQGDIFEAIEMYNKAILIEPSYVDAYNNLGICLQEQGLVDESIKVYQTALNLNPNFADALYNLGVIMKEKKNLSISIDLFSRALSSKPDFEPAQAEKMHQSSYICNWDEIKDNIKLISNLGINKKFVPPFSLLSLEDNPQNHKKRSQIYAKAKFLNKPIPFKNEPLSLKKRIRIGYFSADFHDHATMYLMSKVFKLHDRKKFEIYAYSIGPKKDDFMRENLIHSVDVFDDVSQMSDRDVALLARQDEIDIAVDLKGYTHKSRPGIFGFRAAPIQINYLGYPGTMGADFIDYIIADRIIIPEELRDCYSEEIIYMPNSYQPNNNERAISTREITKSDMGLPENSFVFCSFNNSYKITPKEFDIWMNILKRVEGSVLWLLKSNEWAETNLKKEAQDRGVNSSRIVFANKLPHKEHLRRLQLADLFIDTFNVNAHTTASDALWAGVPVVTKIGKGFAARVAASLLNAVGLPELITNNAKNYETLILDLASTPDKLTKIKKKLSINRLSYPLFDSEKYTKNLENGYEQTYQNYINKRKPKTIYL